MMAEGLAVGGEHHRLIAGRMVSKRGIDPLAENLRVLQKIAKACFAGKALVEEEGIDESAVSFARAIDGVDTVGMACIDALLCRRPSACAIERANRLDLGGRKDDEPDVLLDEAANRLHVDGGFGQPYPLRFAVEPLPEKVVRPPDLGKLIAAGGKRHDDVVENLRNRIPVAFEPGAACLVGIDDPLDGPAVVPFEPR